MTDFKGLRQNNAAKHMSISRQSFGRVLKRARKTVAEALVNGKIIRVAGGCYKLVSPGQRSEKR